MGDELLPKFTEEPEDERRDSEEDTTWKCGTPYQYIVPKPDGDPWEEILKFLIPEDKKRCKSLTDDIQLTLVVSALFSAVVISLYIFQLPQIEPDPMEEIITLLIRLVTVTEDPANKTLAAIPLESWAQLSEDFLPDFQTYGAGLQYLVSLWFSMATVTMGVSALQWLTAYQSYPKCTPKQRFAIMSMRKTAIYRWRVPLLIKLLPVLLLLSIYIFTVAFSGFEAWVLPINLLQVLFGYIVTFAIFLLTVLPALQEYMLQFPRINPFLRGRIQAAPCAYRSIQANVWRLIVISSKATLYIFAGWAYSLLIPLYVVVTTYKGAWSAPLKLVFTSPPLNSPNRHGTWSDLDWEWLMIRWTHFMELYDTYMGVEFKPQDVSGLHFDERLLYDAIEGLIYVAEGQVTSPQALYAAYYCFVDLSLGSLGLRSRPHLTDAIATPDTIRSNRYIQALLSNPTNYLPFHASSLSSAIGDPTLGVLHEENVMLFLQSIFARGAGRMTSEQSPNPIWPPAFSSEHLSIIAQHLAELHVRVKRHFFVDRLLRASSPFFAENHNLLPRHADWSLVYFYQYVDDVEAKKEVTRKCLGLLARLFEECGQEWQLELRMGALLTHSNLYQLILNGARATHYATNDRDGYFSPSELQTTVFAALRHGLILFLSQPTTTRADTMDSGAGPLVNVDYAVNSRPRPDLLFYCACIYVQYLSEREAGDSPLMDALDDIVPLLRSYRAQCPPNALLERSLGVTFTPHWWSFLGDPDAQAGADGPGGAKTDAKKKKTTFGKLFSRGLSTKRAATDGSVRRGRLVKKHTSDSFRSGSFGASTGASVIKPRMAGMSSAVELDEGLQRDTQLHHKVHGEEDEDDEQGHTYPPTGSGDPHDDDLRPLMLAKLKDQGTDGDKSHKTGYNLV